MRSPTIEMGKRCFRTSRSGMLCTGAAVAIAALLGAGCETYVTEEDGEPDVHHVEPADDIDIHQHEAPQGTPPADIDIHKEQETEFELESRETEKIPRESSQPRENSAAPQKPEQKQAEPQ